MFCEECGNKLLEGDRFCPVCGKIVEETEDDFDLSFADERSSNVTTGMGYGYPESEEKPKKRQEDRETLKRKTEKPSNKRKKHVDEDDEWEKEERKEKITFIVLGIVIIALIAVIVMGVAFLLKSDNTKENKREPQLTEEQKEQLLHKNEVEETPIPDATQELTPEPTQELTPEPTQEVTPVPTKEVTPIPTKTPVQQVTPIPTQPPVVIEDEDYIIPDSSTRYLTNADLNALTEAEIRIARNEIYARHGRKFKSEDLTRYFESKAWYVPSVEPEQFDGSYLNAIEVENLKFITNYEKAHNMNQ